MDDLLNELVSREAVASPAQAAPKGLPKGFTLGLMGSNMFDGATTAKAIHGGAKELNPLMRPIAGNTAAMVGVKGGLGALEAFLLNKLSKGGHPKLAKGLGIGLMAAPTLAGINNLRIK